jgi:hypothetical protein
MKRRWVVASLAACSVVAAPALLSAQQPQSVRQAQATPKGKQNRAQPADPELDIEELTPSQIRRAQEQEPPAAAKSAPKAPPKQAAPAASRAIACSGPFGKDSSHLKLATAFKLDNVTYAEVEAPDNAKLMATVLFPKDAKRRLEVWWQNEASRSGTYLIVINGQSTWSAPKGLKLGLPLAAIEKLNGKPFKLKGVDKDNGIAISDWDGGALAQLPGGCKAGVRLSPDAKAPADARSAVTGSNDFTSTDATMRAVKPTVSEIILGY